MSNRSQEQLEEEEVEEEVEEEEEANIIQQISMLLGLSGRTPRSESKTVPWEPGPDFIRENPIVQDVCMASDCENPFVSGRTGENPGKPKGTLLDSLRKREIQGSFSSNKVNLMSRFIPDESKQRLNISARIFCGSFSNNGEVFMSGSQDSQIRLFSYPDFQQIRGIKCRDIQWSIIDTDYSPDQQFLVYSSWSPYAHLCNVGKNSFETHEPLLFGREGRQWQERFCLFSIKFSGSSTEIAGGSNDHNVYVYDLASNRLVTKIGAHDNDVNAVAFANQSPHILFSGSDDTRCKVWDRRAGVKSPVAIFVGHLGGLTHICPKGDGNYLITNSKDQTIKLWDLRKPSKEDIKSNVSQFSDYRYQGFSARAAINQRLPQDTSIMTYMGHSVERTLIRAKFSPLHTTGQRYIYSGSSDGCVRIWDTLTGQILRELTPAHDGIVRDASWHPFEPVIASSSWDGMIKIWEPKDEEEEL